MKTNRQHTCIEELFRRMVLRQINKTRIYHPTLMREFTAEELELLFGGPHSLEECHDEIESFLEFAAREKITNIKVLMQCAQMLLPHRINGGICCGDPFIEISTDIIKNKVVIEVDDDRVTLSKEELIRFYKTKEKSKIGKQS